MKSLLSVLSLAALTTASPIVARATLNDIDILNYALTLEHLEATFYRQGLANYTRAQFIAAGFTGTFYENIREIAYDEKSHVDFLTKALGDKAVQECTYSFPSTDVASFVALASVLEGVGVSAYLGAAASIADADYLTAAGSILTVEARHNAYIRAGLNQSPFPQPFDAPLSPNSVYTLAAPFIVSCPASNAPLPVKAFPTLTLGTKDKIASGTEILLLTPNYYLRPKDGVTPIYAGFITVTGPIIADAVPVDGGFKVVVPAGVNGQTYVVLTACKDVINDETVAAGPAIVEITNPYPHPI